VYDFRMCSSMNMTTSVKLPRNEEKSGPHVFRTKPEKAYGEALGFHHLGGRRGTGRRARRKTRRRTPKIVRRLLAFPNSLFVCFACSFRISAYTTLSWSSTLKMVFKVSSAL